MEKNALYKGMMKLGAYCKNKKRSEMQMRQILIIIVNNLMTSCKHFSIEDMISDHLGRGLVHKAKKKKHHFRRMHLLRRNQQYRKS